MQGYLGRLAGIVFRKLELRIHDLKEEKRRALRVDLDFSLAGELSPKLIAVEGDRQINVGRERICSHQRVEILRFERDLFPFRSQLYFSAEFNGRGLVRDLLRRAAVQIGEHNDSQAILRVIGQLGIEAFDAAAMVYLLVAARG